MSIAIYLSSSKVFHITFEAYILNMALIDEWIPLFIITLLHISLFFATFWIYLYLFTPLL